MTSDITIRTATLTEQTVLEDLQLRASLTNAGDRDALLANPDAIENCLWLVLDWGTIWQDNPRRILSEE